MLEFISDRISNADEPVVAAEYAAVDEHVAISSESNMTLLVRRKIGVVCVCLLEWRG